MPADPFPFHSDSPNSPAAVALAIVPSNTLELPQVTNAIYVSIAGHLTLRPLRASADVV